MRAVVLLALVPTFALAQSPTPRPEELGTVTGHILCADTQRPARLADVRLVPIPSASTRTGFSDVLGNQVLAEAYTDMSGGYTISRVAPGQYYMRVELGGYITPITSFTPEQLIKPTPEDQQRIQQELQLITVAPHSTLRADATLQRSASISGTVLYEDGSPAIGIRMHLIRRNTNGELTIDTPNGAFTDSRGAYHIDSVAPGEYIVQANLRFFEQTHSTTPMILATRISFSLPVYSGEPASVFRMKDAAVVRAEAGVAMSDVDITLPLSQLHDVSGTLVAKDGHTINAGEVALLFADDRSLFASVVLGEDATFHFPYVPEGSYVLAVHNARDVIYGLIINGAAPPTRVESQTTRTYDALEQPLTVQSDMQSLNVTVPDKPVAKNVAGNN